MAGLTLVCLSACGPVTSTKSLNTAEDKVAEAKESSAPYEAVYEYTLAAEYLAKAQEEWGYSDWQKAQRYAELAERYAKEALRRIQGGPGLAGKIIAEADEERAAATADEDAE
jgi:hypothetical protein